MSEGIRASSEHAKVLWWETDPQDSMEMAIALDDRLEQLAEAGKDPSFLPEHVRSISQFQMVEHDFEKWNHAVRLAVSRHANDAEYAWLMSVPNALLTGQAPLDMESAFLVAAAGALPRPEDTSQHIELRDAEGSLSREEMLREFLSSVWTEKEWQAARRTVINAHYTNPA